MPRELQAWSLGKMGSMATSRTTPIVPDVTPTRLLPGRLHAGAELDGARISGDLSGLHAPDVRVLESELIDAVADEAMLRGSSWADARWVRVRATSLDLARSVFRDALWDGCRVGAVTLSAGTITRVLLRDCKLDYVNLRQSTITDLTIDRCTLGEVDLGDAVLTRVRVVASDIGTLLLSGSRSAHVDLSGAGLLRIEGLAALRGITLSETQAYDLAPALVRHLGGVVVTP